ncbi:hypothetical protein J4440_01210 [Candidatus Woesearchaeota archaeon]|nr:hypothetical protein [Candidatus Woesearchaeota archaeon]
MRKEIFGLILLIVLSTIMFATVFSNQTTGYFSFGKFFGYKEKISKECNSNSNCNPSQICSNNKCVDKPKIANVSTVNRNVGGTSTNLQTNPNRCSNCVSYWSLVPVNFIYPGYWVVNRDRMLFFYNDIKNVGNPMQNLFYITLETNWDASHGSPRDSYIVRLDNIGSYSALSEKIKFNINNTAGKLVNGTINYQVLLSRNEVINIPIENNKKTLKLTPYSFSLYNYTLTEISYYNINYTQRNVIIGYKIE